MKKIIVYLSLFAASWLLMIACKKETKLTADFSTTENSAFLRVIQASPYFRNVFNAPDSFNVYVNSAKVNASFLTYASIFPASGTNNGYIAVTPGLQQIKMSIHGFTTGKPDSTQLINFTKVFLTGQYYTLLVTDSIKSLRDSSQMFLLDKYTTPTLGNYSLRFVHAVLNDTLGMNVDIFSTRRNGNIFSNIKPGTVSGFSTLPYNTQLNDTLFVRRTGTLNNLTSINNIGFSNQRVYTLYYRGDAILTSGTKARLLTTYIHQ